MITNATNIKINIPQKKLADLCRRYHIRWLALFGSVLRDDFQQNSDVDMLVAFDGRQPTGLMKLATIEAELSDVIGRRVDLNTAGSISPYYRQQTLAEAVTLYDAA